ncbi:MAG: NAD(P)/FAD-dependent oxidoreductase [Actinobacteria bacterium]|nr:NAD(P)/FAD-dependent oxidoreductase [Actinomycetota bacterium]
MTATVTEQVTEVEQAAIDWLEHFEQAASARDAEALQSLFLEDSWWRDLLAFTWDLITYRGDEAIVEQLVPRLADAAPSGFRLEDGKEVTLDPDAGFIGAFFTFDTAIAQCRGFLRLMRDGEGDDAPWKAWTLLTAMEQLTGHVESRGAARPQGVEHGTRRDRESWLDRRRKEHDFTTEAPDVVVVGAGQAGLTVAARLRMFGVPTLVVERNQRIGDNWRQRYHTLVLHDPVWYDHMPYLPFPDHWPVFSPKDKLAGWFESYAAALELNVWTGTDFLGGDFSDKTGRWSVQVRRADGSQQTLHPRHVVLATGMSGVPFVPDIAGEEDFTGEIAHSAWHSGAQPWSGKKAVVVGTGNSGHDIAHEFHEYGADTTVVQRSSTYVMTSKNGIDVLFEGLYEEGGPPTEDADLIFASIPYPLLAEFHKEATKEIARRDADLLERLEAAGFSWTSGEDGSGLFMLYLRRGGGYYIDVGASELIADGKIKVKQGFEITRFTPEGLEFEDGSTLPADIVVLATGYQNMRESARHLFGDEVADQVTPVWGLDADGELRTMWRRSGHPGLWFMGGNLHQARHYSKMLAVQIKAVEEGLVERSWEPATNV